MIQLHKLVATVFGIGYIGKGGGTIAAVACCLLWLSSPPEGLPAFWQAGITLVVFIAGVWSGNVVDSIWGKDSNKVVIDEVGGMLISLLLLPVTFRHVLAALVLFRFFDIAKPLFIRKMELLPKGWGVMADDLLAGVYARLLLHVIIMLGWL